MSDPKKITDTLPAKKLKAIWRDISPADWLSLLQEYRPNNKWVLTGNIIKGLCINPAHADTSPSFIVNLDRGSAHCFGASCSYSEWNPVRFVSDLSNIAYATAIRKLKSRFNIKLPNTFVQNVQQIEDNNQLKQILLRVTNLELTEALAHSENKEFAYAAPLISELRVRRKFPEGAAHLWPVGILPPRERLSARIRENKEWEKFLEPAHNYLAKYLAVPGGHHLHEGSFLFFFYTAPNTIGRIRIRHAGTKDFYAVEDPFTQDVGFFGLNTFTHLLGELDKHPLYVVEGEFDALSIISNVKAIGGQDLCTVATGGSMENDLDQLMEFGFQNIYLVPDNDAEGVGGAKKLLMDNKGVTRVFRWTQEDETTKVKDADEAIRAYGFTKFMERLVDAANFPRPNEWATEQLEKDLAGVDPKDIRSRCEKAAALGMVLKNHESEKTAFLDYAASTYNLPKEAIIQDMVSDDDDLVSFASRLARKLRKDEYHFLSQRQTANNGAVILAWGRKKRVIRSFALNSKSSLQATFAMDLGSLLDYIRKEIGMPAFMEYKMNQKGMPVPLSDGQREMLITQSFHEALQRIVADITPKEWLTELGQGVHWLDDVFENDPVPRLFIVNGPKLFQGTVQGDTVKFEEMTSPVIGKYFFRLQSKPWSSNISSVKDLEEGIKHDPHKLFDDLCNIFRRGWRFKNHDLETTFLAADVLYTPVFAVFHHLSMVDVAGETHSGKTTLMQVIGGNEFPDLRLCEAVTVVDDFTAAGIRQAMNGVRLRVFLDEFEDDDAGVGRPSRRALAVREMLELIRNMTSGSSRTLRGTTQGESVEYNLHFPTTVGGIFTMQEPRDLNRFVHIRTQRIEGFQDPTGPIRAAYKPEELKKIRRGVTLSLIARIPQLLKAYESAKLEFAQNESLPSNIMTRLKDNFLPAVAILKLIGVDYTNFLADFCKLKMEEMQEQGGNSQESANIWDHVLHTQFDLSRYTPDGDLTGFTSLSKVLSDRSSRAQLNGSDLGAYYLEKKNWLVVFWQKAITGVLRNSPRYRGAQYPGRLKVLADSDPRVITKDKLKNNTQLIQEIRHRAGANVRLDQISVIDLANTLAEHNHDEEDAVADATAKERLLEDIPDATSLVDPPVKQRGNFEV